jgi:osmotically inducible protein OsmC
MSELIFVTEVTSTSGRDGRSVSKDNILDVRLAIPKELGGPGGATNPEQLFAAGYSACFLSAIKLVATKEKISISTTSKVTAVVGLKKMGLGYGLDIELQIELPGLDPKQADEVIAQAHMICPYSNSTRGNVKVRLVRK